MSLKRLVELEVGSRFRLGKGMDKCLYAKLISCGLAHGSDYTVLRRDALIGFTVKGKFSTIAIDKVTAKKIYVTVV